MLERRLVDIEELATRSRRHSFGSSNPIGTTATSQIFTPDAVALSRVDQL
jgi:hypothetical protein